MDLFRIIINKILYKIPLKLLILILIFLFLAFFIFGSDVKANNYLPFTYTSYINNTTYTLNVTSNNDANYWILFADSNGAPYYLYFYPRSLSNFTVTFNSDGSTFLQKFNNDACFICRCNNQGNGNYNTTYQNYSNSGVTVPSGYKILYATNNVINSSDNSVYLPALTINSYYQYQEPYIDNTSDIATWSFDNLIINTGNLTPYWIYNQERFF